MKLILALVLSLSGLPALAGEYLIQQPGETRATGFWRGNRPVPGVSCAPGSLVCQWNVINGDTYPGHYWIDPNGGTQNYAPPVPAPPGAPPPDPNQFSADCAADPAIPSEAYGVIQLITNAYNSGNAKAAALCWQKEVAARRFWLQANVASAIRAHASANHLVLTTN